MGIIYCAQNKVNGKRYIGQSVNPLSHKKSSYLAIARCQKSNGNRNPSLLTIAIWEFGENAFEWTVLFDDIDDEDLDQMEIDTISIYKALVPHGYNRSPGGKRNISKHSEETRKKMSESQRLRGPTTEETRRRMSEAAKNISNETRKKRSENAKNISIETRQKMSDAKKGKTLSEETRKKMREARARVLARKSCVADIH